MEPGAIMFWRYFLMGGVLVAICLLTGNSLKIPKQHLWRLLFAGFNSMGIYMIMFMEGVKFTFAAEAAIILASNPIIVAIWQMALGREARSILKVVGGIVALSGVALVVLGRPGMAGSSAQAPNRLLGDFLMFIGAISWSWAVVISKPISVEIKPLPLFTMSMLGGLPVVVLFGWKPAMAVHWALLSPWQVTNFLLVSLGSGVIGMVFYYKGIADLPASKATMYQFLVPIVATGFAVAILHERLAWIQGIGVLVLLAGVSVAQGLIQVRRKAEVTA